MGNRASNTVNELIIEALKSSKDGFGVYNEEDILVFCNDKLAESFGFQSHEIIGMCFETMLRQSHSAGVGVATDDHIEGLVERAKASRLEKGFASFESDMQDGSWMQVSRLKTDDNFIYIYVTDITKLKKTESELRDALRYVKKLAATDSLTGISNRRHFLETAESEFQRSVSYGHPLSILALDIDHFKSINDNYGHQAGDQVLEAITLCCQKLLRESDVFGRLGGEEFSILLPDTSQVAAKITAQRILKAVAALEVNYQDQIIRFTTSIGITELSKNCDNLEVLMNQSDEALYEAKHKGRNRMEIWRIKH